MCTKANRQNLNQCPQDVKEAAYRRLVRPILEYGSCVWDHQGVVLQQEIEKVQNMAATVGLLLAITVLKLGV